MIVCYFFHDNFLLCWTHTTDKEQFIGNVISRVYFALETNKTATMSRYVIIAAALVATASAQLLGHPISGSHVDDQYTNEPYSFTYAVEDREYGTAFNEQRNDDGQIVHGQYQVQLPDGRLQTVTYTADHGPGGYVADVKYDGQAIVPVVSHGVVLGPYRNPRTDSLCPGDRVDLFSVRGL